MMATWKVKIFKYNTHALVFINSKRLKDFHITENNIGYIKIWYKSEVKGEIE